jgi:hypothetical protein
MMKIQLINSDNDESYIGNANVSSYPPLGIIPIVSTIERHFANYESWEVPESHRVLVFGQRYTWGLICPNTACCLAYYGRNRETGVRPHPLVAVTCISHISAICSLVDYCRSDDLTDELLTIIDYCLIKHGQFIALKIGNNSLRIKETDDIENGL